MIYDNLIQDSVVRQTRIRKDPLMVKKRKITKTMSPTENQSIQHPY